jgi:hypothetical protein
MIDHIDKIQLSDYQMTQLIIGTIILGFIFWFMEWISKSHQEFNNTAKENHDKRQYELNILPEYERDFHFESHPYINNTSDLNYHDLEN